MSSFLRFLAGVDVVDSGAAFFLGTGVDVDSGSVFFLGTGVGTGVADSGSAFFFLEADLGVALTSGTGAATGADDEEEDEGGDETLNLRLPVELTTGGSVGLVDLSGFFALDGV